MTEKDLFKYKYAVEEERRRRNQLIEQETRLTSMRQALSSEPRGGGGSDTTGRVAAALDRLDRCRAKLKEAIEEVALAELILDAARRCLDEKERSVFDSLYFGYINKSGGRTFCTIFETSKRLNYSQSAIYGLRRKILTKISSISA